MSLVSPTDHGGFDGSILGMYPPAKKSKISASRRFPLGCGRNPTTIDGSLASSKESHREHRPRSTQVGGHDAPMRGSAAEARDAETVEDEPGESQGSTEGGGHRIAVEAGLWKKAILGNLVKRELDEPESISDSEMKLEDAERSLGQHESPVFAKGNIFYGGIAKSRDLERRKNSLVVRRFPVGCGRNAALMSREQLLGAAATAAAMTGKVSGTPLGNGNRREAVSWKKASTVKKEPEAAKNGDSDLELRSAEGSLASLVSHVNGTAIADSDRERSDDSKTLEVCAQRIVQALMATPRCPWSRGKRPAK